MKANVARLPRIAAFGDELRDGVKGHYAHQAAAGFVGGQPGLEESVKFGIVAATQHPQLDYQKVNYSKAPWASQPGQTINYVACHDDRTLWDKLRIANPTASEDEVNSDGRTEQYHCIHVAGRAVFEYRRRLSAHQERRLLTRIIHPTASTRWIGGARRSTPAVAAFYRRLLALRRAHPAFRLPSRNWLRST
ncbi:MAG: hypothetical protein WKG07_15050 [Hymenobacter sp.]